MPSKLIIVDVGTHMAQEYKALFAHSRYEYFRHWVTHLNRIRRAGGKAYKLSRFREFLVDTKWLKTRRRDVTYIMVEPNARLFALPVYRESDISFNIALSKEPNILSLRQLFLAGGELTGQGSSLFVEKPNVNTSEFDWVINVDAKHFADQVYKAIGDEVTCPLLLRINNEGAEVEVIESFFERFGTRLVGVLGSLCDVEKVKGASALEQLYQFMNDRGIPFMPLHSDFATWPEAARFVRTMIEKQS
ncbi:hypothetical protein [Marimonas lutisalis]|uniref:hypothetical protein n=1 Tax=Marimonas lutisalis TaxID=2545756 RepID=UPI00195FC91F|nr:hypothetical protein [Marimonas lutisalis]